jgi:hypothetical protein
MNNNGACLEYRIAQENPLLLLCTKTQEIVSLEWVVESAKNEEQSNTSNWKSTKREK